MNSQISQLKIRYPNGLAIRDDISLSQANDKLSVIGHQSFSISNLSPSDLHTICELKNGASWSILENKLTKNVSTVITEMHRRNQLRNFSRNLFEGTRNVRQVEWLAHLTNIPNEVQRKLQETRFLIIGCGGTGSIIVEHLVAMGVDKFVLVDFDSVDVSNFNRQFVFRANDVGKSKTSCLRTYILERNPSADVCLVDKKIKNAEEFVDLLQDIDVGFTVCCADQPVGKINAYICEGLLKQNTPCIFGNVGLQDGQIGPLLVGDEEKRRYITDMMTLARYAETILKTPIMKASFGPINTIISAWMALEIMRYFIDPTLPASSRSLIEIDLIIGQNRVIKTW